MLYCRSALVCDWVREVPACAAIDRDKVIAQAVEILHRIFACERTGVEVTILGIKPDAITIRGVWDLSDFKRSALLLSSLAALEACPTGGANFVPRISCAVMQKMGLRKNALINCDISRELMLDPCDHICIVWHIWGIARAMLER